MILVSVYVSSEIYYSYVTLYDMSGLHVYFDKTPKDFLVLPHSFNLLTAGTAITPPAAACPDCR